MLLGRYINASRVTVWPINAQCLGNPISLEDAHYHTFNGVMNDLDTAISLLQPGVEEISSKCGPPYANQLRLLLNKVRYLQRDAMKYGILIRRSISPSHAH